MISQRTFLVSVNILKTLKCWKILTLFQFFFFYYSGQPYAGSAQKMGSAPLKRYTPTNIRGNGCIVNKAVSYCYKIKYFKNEKIMHCIVHLLPRKRWNELQKFHHTHFPSPYLFFVVFEAFWETGFSITMYVD